MFAGLSTLKVTVSTGILCLIWEHYTSVKWTLQCETRPLDVDFVGMRLYYIWNVGISGIALAQVVSRPIEGVTRPSIN